MTAWLNLAVLIIATKLFLYFYIKSVSPALRAGSIVPSPNGRRIG
jgi:hypothetical protein